LTAEQVQSIEQRGTPSETVMIYSPVGGVVGEVSRQPAEQ